MATSTPTIIAGKYEILGRLGQGGQASVFKVRHLGLNEVRALKLLPEHDAADDSVARFRREGRALARLRHPHIVQVFDLGRDDDRYYLEMEYVDGPNLAQYLKEGGRPPLHEAFEIARQVASALAYAHAQPYEDATGQQQPGLVHRDVKPSNVLLRHGTPPHATLADFGIVKLGDALDRTTTGVIVGTYRYSAPEQLGLKRDGNRLAVDARADVFALGLVLFELLEGTQFNAGREPAEILARLLYDPTELEPEFTAPVPAAARDLVRRMIRRSPDARPGSMLEVVRALDQLIADVACTDDAAIRLPRSTPPPPAPRDEPTVRVTPAAPTPTWESPPLPASRLPAVVPGALVASGAFALLALVLGWFLLGGNQDEKARETAPRVATAPTIAPPPTSPPPSMAPAPPREAATPPKAAEPAPAVVEPLPQPTTPPATARLEPPRIVARRPTEPVLTVSEGGGIELSVQVDRDAAARALRYRWLLDGEEVGSGPAWRFVAPFVETASAQFRVAAEVIDADGRAAAPATWTVAVTRKGPELQQPLPASLKVRVDAGGQQIFRIRAAAPETASPLRYQWSVDGARAANGDQSEFTWTASDPGSHRVEVAVADRRGASSTHRWTVESVARPTPTTSVPAVAAVPTAAPPAPASAAGSSENPPSQAEAEAWLNRLRAAWAAKDAAALRQLGELAPGEEKQFRKKIADNNEYTVRIGDASILLDSRAAMISFDRIDTDDGRDVPQPRKTVRLQRGPGGLVVVGR